MNICMEQDLCAKFSRNYSNVYRNGDLRKKFEIFLYTHQLYGLYIIFYVFHVGDSWLCMILLNIFLFFIDRHLRFPQSTKRSMLLNARLLPSDNIELTFSKVRLSKLQRHPFSITSSSNLEEDKIRTWTQELYDHISSSSNDSLEVSTEGPYGPTSFDFLRHDSLILSSEIIFQSQNSTTKLPDLLLVCSFKHYQDLSLLHLIFPPSGISVSDISKLKLRIEAYVTRDNEPQTTTSADGNHVKTKWFKPNNKDSPISPVLGPNNLLWLGVVILTSFTMFLLLIANSKSYTQSHQG
ncbi:LOW QUALITY PROTEIN: hypothetical protein HID58_002192 [Brassica napus]|uniref:FAD-binding 8 domain-containing protein n=1 Tax=Brassica napus TaxID=3708 RepID=A0ABQ8ELT3_BRANA|nr:LOW QUALITY PROTEIN: hypothetical protein HID58_002192 [Brassica napus]